MVTFTHIIDKGIRRGKTQSGGLTVAIIDMTTSTGSGGADYSSGFAITSNAAKMGFRKIVAVVGLSAVNGAGTTLSNKLWFTYDSVAGTLRAWVGSTGAANITEEAGGTNLNAGSVIRMLVLGV